MSARPRRVADVQLEIPPNVTFLDFSGYSDGNSSTWPHSTARVVDHEGCVNFHEPVPLDDSRALRWRLLTADAIAAKLKMPDGAKYILRDWPAGYRLFDHHKGKAGDPRHDLYLYGAQKKRFRSINEFIPHAIWLYQNPSLDPNSFCECKYCAGKTQKEVTASMSDILRLTPTHSPSPSRPKRDKQPAKPRDILSRSKGKQRANPVYASVQRELKPLKPLDLSSHVLHQPMLVERRNDVRAMHFTSKMSKMTLRRWFREGEIVWCALESPIPSTTPGIFIEFWPALVDEVKLKTEPVLRQVPTPTPPQNSTASTSAINQELDMANGEGPMLEPSETPLPWEIKQSTQYKVQLLAVSHMYYVADEVVLPYQAYMPSDKLMTDMLQFPANQLNFDEEGIKGFNPCPEDGVPVFNEAISAFAMAIQIASVSSGMWSLTDQYEVKFAISPPPPVPPQPMQPQSISGTASFTPPTPAAPKHPLAQSISSNGHLSIEDALDEEARQESQTVKTTTAAVEAYFQSASTIDPTMSKEAAEDTVRRVLGRPPSPGTDVITQTRFQGMWWGAERIWVDDFVRLKVPRRAMAPNGAENIHAPAGPGPTVAQEWVDHGRDLTGVGAGTRSVFMRLDGLVVLEVPVGDDGTKTKEARAYGQLYELVDEDWEEPVTSAMAESSSSATPPQAMGSPQKSNGPAADGRLKGDLTPVPLPQAPIGYKFRPMLKPGYESTICLGIISGRYYPRILHHPRMVPAIHAALDDIGGVASSTNLWALEGLAAGYHNSVDPTIYRTSRTAMFQDAEMRSREMLLGHQRENMASSVDSMDLST